MDYPKVGINRLLFYGYTKLLTVMMMQEKSEMNKTDKNIEFCQQIKLYYPGKFMYLAILRNLSVLKTGNINKK